MLQNVPAGVGQALRGVRGDATDLVSANPAFAAVPEVIQVSSPRFGQDGAIPADYTEDGRGISPPLEWIGVPPEAESLVLLIEDQDSPTPRPLVHTILAGLEAADGGLAEGALPSRDHPGDGLALGRNSFWQRAYLPPDPPTGHGVHRYVFQLFALDMVIDPDQVSGRGGLVEALKDHVIARGTLVGTYERR